MGWQVPQVDELSAVDLDADYTFVNDASDTVGTATAPASATGALKRVNARNWTKAGISDVRGAAGSSPSLYISLTGDTTQRYRLGLNAADIPSLSAGPGNAVRDAFLEYVGAARWRLGQADAAAPVAQRLGVQNVVAGTTNIAGAAFRLDGSQSSGSALGGPLEVWLAPAGSSGNTQNALVKAWSFTAPSHLVPTTTNANDLGTTSIQMRTVYTSTIANMTGALTVGHAAGDDVRIKNATSGGPVLGFYNSSTTRLASLCGLTGATGFLAWEGITNAHAGLLRNGAMLECKLGDNSAYAALGAEFMGITDGIAAPAAVAGRARIFVDSADGDLKIIYGDGTVKLIVVDT